MSRVSFSTVPLDDPLPRSTTDGGAPFELELELRAAEDESWRIGLFFFAVSALTTEDLVSREPLPTARVPLVELSPVDVAASSALA